MVSRNGWYMEIPDGLILYAKYWRILSISESLIKKVILSKQCHHKGYHTLGRVSRLLYERE